MTGGGRKEKKQYAAPEMLYNLDGEHSIKTIHQHSGKGYSGSPGAETINLGDNSKKQTIIDMENKDDDMSALSNMSKRDFIDMLCKTKVSTTDNKGSTPSAQEPYSVDSANDSSHSSGSSFASLISSTEKDRATGAAGSG